MLGLRTVIYPVSDLEQASQWYSAVFGVTPYFSQPFYIGFEVAGFELGLVPDGQPARGGALAYWGCEDIENEVERIRLLGGVVIEAPTDVGEGIIVATIGDPFGNCVGLIKNPHVNIAKFR